MYCKKCGKEIADDSIFCKYCGENISDEKSGESKAAAEVKTQITAENPDEKKPDIKKIMIITAAVLILIAVILAAVLAVNSKGSSSDKETAAADETVISETETETEKTTTEKETAEKTTKETAKTETTAKETKMDVKTVRKNFDSFLDLYYKWLNYGTAYEANKNNSQIYFEDEAVGYLITDSKVISFDNIKSKFGNYCTDEVFDSLPYDCPYREADGRLYLTAEARSVWSYTFIAEDVKKQSDEKYLIKSLCIGQECGPPDLVYAYWTYEKNSSGKWLLTNLEFGDVWAYNNNDFGKYIVTTESSDLNVRRYPSTESEIVGKAKKGAYVTVEWSAGDWSYLSYSAGGNQIVGWVKSEYLTFYSSD